MQYTYIMKKYSFIFALIISFFYISCSSDSYNIFLTTTEPDTINIENIVIPSSIIAETATLIDYRNDSKKLEDNNKLKIIEENIGVDKIVVMVQKEVGNRFKANPNTKDYGSFHMTINTEVEDPHSIFDFLDNFWF